MGEEKKETLADAVIDSILQPGLNPRLRAIMNQTFYALFAVLGLLLILTSGNLHVVALLTLAIALFYSIDWFLKELVLVQELVKVQKELKEE